MDNQAKLNKPITDEELFDAGVNRDVPEHEPVPPPPLKLPKDTNLSSVGVEYRAMSGVTTPPPIQSRASRRTNDKAYAWVEAWQPMPPMTPEEPSPNNEIAEAGEAPAVEHSPIAPTDHAEDPPQHAPEAPSV